HAERVEQPDEAGEDGDEQRHLKGEGHVGPLATEEIADLAADEDEAAETSASSAIADCTPVTVVSRSSTTAEIETFISDVSTTSKNIAMPSRIAARWAPL